jgi:Mg2+ and Co2+ transporter CorA
VSGTAALVGALVSPLGGVVGDRIGFRPVLVAAMAVPASSCPDADRAVDPAAGAARRRPRRRDGHGQLDDLRPAGDRAAADRRSAALNLVYLPLYAAGIVGPAAARSCASVAGVNGLFAVAARRLCSGAIVILRGRRASPARALRPSTRQADTLAGRSRSAHPLTGPAHEPGGYDGVVPNLAFPRPLPRPRGRTPRNPTDAIAPADIASPDIIEAAGIRWIHIESPRTADRDWLEAHFDFHPLDYEDVYSRNNRSKLDQYDDYVFIVLQFPLFEKETGRILTAELDLFMGPDYLITLPSVPLRHWRRCSSATARRKDLREATFSKGSGYLLYKIVDTCVDASFPMLARWASSSTELEDDIFEGSSSEIVRSISDTKQEIINFRRIVPAADRGAARPGAREAALSSRKSWRSTSTTSRTRPSGSGTPSRTTRRSSRRSSRPTSRCCRIG